MRTGIVCGCVLVVAVAAAGWSAPSRADVGGAAHGVCLLLQSTAGANRAEKYSVTALMESAPDALAADVRGTLAKTGYRVADPAGKTICDVWLRTELPLIEKFEPQNDLVYPIQPGTFIAAIRYPEDTSDYRKQAVKAGTYTLRYGHQPQDGNHIGTAQFRDFVIVSRAADDKSPGLMSQDEAIDLSEKVTGTTHPAILSLLPAKKDRGKLPTMAHDDTLNLEVLVAKTSTKSGSPIKELQIELVTVGHAPE